MTKQELLRLMRLLSALENMVMMMPGEKRVPDYIHEDMQACVEALEREIVKP